MYSVIGLLKRTDGTTHTDFCTWWEESHAPHVLKMPGLLEYVRYPIDESMNGATGELSAEAPYDGVAIITFESKRAFLDSFASSEGQADNRSFNSGAPSSTVLLGEAVFELRGEIPEKRR
jgi:uncharacterized protein (TIGR02118 family)